MLHQKEWVPQHFELNEPQGGQASAESAASVTLRSEKHVVSDTFDFSFEAIRPNVFRTTFLSAQHILPPFPSIKRPEPNFNGLTPEVTSDPEHRSKTIKIGETRAVVEWSGAPIISLFLDGSPKTLHRDLSYRSYAADSTGVAHYTQYKKGTLHVGLGEKAAPMDLSGRGFQITASDTFGYDAYKTDPLYKHIPLLINVTPEGCVAIFSTSHSRSTWAIGSEIDGMWGHFKVHRQAHGGLEEYLIVGKTVADVIRSYAELAGFPLLVPRYMMGYIGGGMKYSMTDEPRGSDNILSFLKKAEEYGMPCSAFQMSSGYTVAETEPKTRNVFTWNRHRFPDPRAFTREAHQHNVRLLANIKPYVLANHPAYPELVKSGGFFSDPVTKQVAVARLWSAGGGESGEGSHLDFTSKAGFGWWYKGVKDLKDVGIDAMWNDNNEYNLPSDDWQCALENVPLPSKDVSKSVGLWGRALHTELNGKSSYDATIEAEPDARPLVLTRSATAGTMRYAASSWSGDNVTSWDGMKGANGLALNAGFSLLQCYGHDIGGFEGPQPTPEHLVRWIQLGIHSPRFAINCYKTNPNDNLVGEVIEPWQYPSVTPIIRNAIKRRYELVPYTYAQALKSHFEAIPPQRWTGWGYESDPEVWTEAITRGDTQYWFGDALLIAGVYQPGVSTARVYLPGKASDPGFLNTSAPYEHLSAGKWHEISSLWHNSIPVLARVGSAVPVGKSKPTTSSAIDDPEFPNLEKDDWRGVEIFPPPLVQAPLFATPASDRATNDSKESQVFESTWLEDDGISSEAKTEVARATIKYQAVDDEISVSISVKKDGAYEPLWLKNGANIILPVGEERKVRLFNGEAGEATQTGRDEKGRHVWKINVVV